MASFCNSCYPAYRIFFIIMKEQKQNLFHARTPEEVLKELDSDINGLTEKEAKIRLEKFGYNEIPEKEKRHPFLIFLKQFGSVMIYILFAAVVISFFLKHYTDAYIIIAIIILNAAIGFGQEYKAEKAIGALKKMIVQSAKVMRGGELIVIPVKMLVPGDIILLEEGDRFPADARLLEIKNFRTVEASLTGESLPIDKDVKPLPEKTAIADQRNMIWMGTFAAAGTAKAAVVATGAETAIGKIAQTIEKIEKKKSHFEEKTDKLAFQMGTVAIAGALITFLVGYFIRGFEFVDIFLFTIASLVAGVPEGLPAILAITLSFGAGRMAKRNAIIRTLPATETLGVVDIIITDKTGTLTENTMTVEKIILPGEDEITITGKGWESLGTFTQNDADIIPLDNPRLDKLLHITALCNNARVLKKEDQPGSYQTIGDPTECALTVLSEKAGIKKEALLQTEQRIDDLPFSPELKYRASLSPLVKKGSGKEVFVVGAPETVIAASGSVLGKDGVKKITSDDKNALLKDAESLAKKAMRVIGVAYKQTSEKTEALSEDMISDLVFVGVIGMIDPPRPEVSDAISKAKEAGIRVIMATGDHKETALAIAKRIGLHNKKSKSGLPEVYTEKELEELAEKEFEKVIRNVSVFARLTPKMKLRIAERLQKSGHVVAMTGDGVNDAPALKTADIGIAMGIIGTDVARESSSIVLADDNFASIINAIEEGRIVFSNTRRSSAFLVTTNFAEAVTIIATMLLGFPLPLLATQVLWLNLVTDSAPALALAAESGEADVLSIPPRKKDENILNKEIVPFLILVVLVMTLATLFIFKLYLPMGIEKARAGVFTVMSFTQFFNMFNMRSIHHSIFKTGVSRIMLAALLFSVFLSIIVIYVPIFAKWFGFEALGFVEFILAVAISSSVLWLTEIYKLIKH
jgi:P-type Ca2+ transporter type 2C